MRTGMQAVRQLALSTTMITGLFIGGVLHARAATAATYYVATNGDNSRSCNTATNINTPKQTISNGIGCLNGAGDRLYIRGGAYNENVLTNVSVSGSSWDNPIWIGAYQTGGGYETVTIVGQGGDHVLEMGPNGPGGQHYIIYDHLHLLVPGNGNYGIATGTGRIRFQHGEITYSAGNEICLPGPQVTQSPGIGVYVNEGATSMEFLDNDIHDIPCQYAFYVHSANVVIDGNRLYNLAGYAIQVYAEQTGCCLDNNIIRNNIIYNNGVFREECAITFNHGANGLIYNNVIYNNQCGIDVKRSATNTGVYNNTLYNNNVIGYGAAIFLENVTGTVVRNNILWQSGGGVYDGGTGTVQSNNLETDPQFVNAAGNDFHLQATSPAIDAGIVLSAVPTDINGMPRGQGAGYDIGAYEYAGSPIPQLPPPTNLKITSVTP
jgi:hypothetical protein